MVWANTYNKFDPASPFGGYKESGFGREGGRHGLEGYLQVSRIDVRKTYKLFIGGNFPALGVRPFHPVHDVRGRSWRTPHWPRARTPPTRSRRRARRTPGWSGRTAYNRGQVVYRIAELMEDRRPRSSRRLRQGEGGTAVAAGKLLGAGP